MSDDDIRKAVEADINQFFADCLTPDRRYPCPIDNVKKLVTDLRERATVLENALEQLVAQAPVRTGDSYFERELEHARTVLAQP